MKGDEIRNFFGVILVVAVNLGSKAVAEPIVPCCFIFGDSLLDSGNNNNLISLAKSNFFPYGVDFGGPSGRFSNGKTAGDVIAELMGFDEYIPPYTTARGRDILRGVNYASAAAGIREETGWHLGDRISFRAQINNYKQTISQLAKILGDEKLVANHLSKCIFAVGVGSNDYLNNYFMPILYQTSRIFPPKQYARVLIQDYAQQIRRLYNLGARKFVLIGVGQIGCIPSALAEKSPDGKTCVAEFNSANKMFNNDLKALVDTLNNLLNNARFIYINSYGIVKDLIDNPSQYGFKVTNAGCCGVGRNRGEITCLPYQSPCPNRNEYIFWDAFHPGEAANIIIGGRAFRSVKPSDAYPFDVHHLALL